MAYHDYVGYQGCSRDEVHHVFYKLASSSEKMGWGARMRDHGGPRDIEFAWNPDRNSAIVRFPLRRLFPDYQKYTDISEAIDRQVWAETQKDSIELITETSARPGAVKRMSQLLEGYHKMRTFQPVVWNEKLHRASQHFSTPPYWKDKEGNTIFGARREGVTMMSAVDDDLLRRGTTGLYELLQLSPLLRRRVIACLYNNFTFHMDPDMMQALALEVQDLTGAASGATTTDETAEVVSDGTVESNEMGDSPGDKDWTLEEPVILRGPGGYRGSSTGTGSSSSSSSASAVPFKAPPTSKAVAKPRTKAKAKAGDKGGPRYNPDEDE